MSFVVPAAITFPPMKMASRVDEIFEKKEGKRPTQARVSGSNFDFVWTRRVHETEKWKSEDSKKTRRSGDNFYVTMTQLVNKGIVGCGRFGGKLFVVSSRNPIFSPSTIKTINWQQRLTSTPNVAFIIFVAFFSLAENLQRLFLR